MTAPVPHARAAARFDSRRLERVFAACFARDYHTRLIGGADEPLYVPAREAGELHRLYYREDYFASALHETAHWCIAGRQRRELPDFGYWYQAEGRDAGSQRAFEAVEDKPQALEWFFSRACGWRFHLSSDNLDHDSGEPADQQFFAARVLARAGHWRRRGLPLRAEQFYRALCREFGTAQAPAELEFSLCELGADCR